MAKIRVEENMQTPVSSMIDVVFLLIIFFVVTASMDEDIIDETLELAKAANVPALEKKDTRAVTINIKADGKYNIQTIPHSKELLKDTLLKHAQKLGSEAPVVVRADKDTLYKYLDEVMAVIGEAKLYKVKIVAESTK